MSAITAVFERLDGTWSADNDVALETNSASRQWPRRLARGLAAADGLVVLGVVTVAAAAFGYAAGVAVLAGLAAAMLTVVVASVRRGYSASGMQCGRPRIGAAIAGLVVAGASFASLSYFGLFDVPRQLTLIALALALALIVLNRGVHQLLVATARRHGGFDRKVVLVGSGGVGLDALRTALANAPDDVTVLGRCGDNEGTDEPLGDVKDAPARVRELGADTVVIAANCMDADELQGFCRRLEALGVAVFIAPEISDVDPHRVSLTQLGGTPMFQVAVGPSRVTLVAKNLADRILGALLGLGSLLVLAPSVAAVKLTSPGPAIFKQTRVGEDGVPFTMFKLRTMHVDAEQRLAELRQQHDGNETLFKLHDDPRVTSAGRVLRRFSIDELPQIWNVVKGDMSLVGPRPSLPHEVATYDDRAYHRLAAKPGLTGLWQVSGRSDLDWAQSVNLDLRYVDNRSMRSDLRILGRTAGAVLGGRGAY